MKIYLNNDREKSGELLERLLNANVQGQSATNTAESMYKVGGKAQRLTTEDMETNKVDTSARHPKQDDDIVSSASMTKMQKRRIKSLCSKRMEDYGDLTDVEKGYDFVIKKEDGEAGFPSYENSKPRRNPTPLAESDVIVSEILANIKSLDGEVDVLSYDELKKVLDGFIKNEKSSLGTASSLKSTSNSNDEDEDAVPKKNPDKEDVDEFEKSLLDQINK